MNSYHKTSRDISEEPSNDCLPQHAVQNEPRSVMQLVRKRMSNFTHQYLAPYTTISWMKVYFVYTSLFWGSVALLWHFNNSHGNMEDELTDPLNWYISNALNAWSSIAYMLPVPFVPTPMKLPLTALAVSSFCLWSDSGVMCRFIDVTSIHWVILNLMVQKTTSPYRHITGHITNVVFAASIGYYIGVDLYEPIVDFYSEYMNYTIGSVTAINMFMTLNTFGFRRNIVIGSITCILGFWCKFRDLNHGDSWGTGVFHILSATGVSIVLLPTKQIK